MKEEKSKKNYHDEEILKAKARKTSIIEGCAYSVSDGFGLRNVTPYALAIGANNTSIALLNSIPGLIGNFSQLFSPKLIKNHSRKTIVLFGVLLQAFMWLAMIIPGWIYFSNKGEYSPQVLILIYTLLISFGAIGGPAWSSWMRDITVKNQGYYFGTRNKIIGIFILIFSVIGGFILDYFKQTNIFIGFIILFSFSFLFRAISGLLFLWQYEPEFKYKEEFHFSLWQFIKRMHSNNFGRFVIFITLITTSTAIAGPFFSVYMLKDLGVSYTFYVAITLVSGIASLIVMPLWGKFSDKYGHIQILKLTGFFIGIVPLLWILTSPISENRIYLFIWLSCIELFSGIVWGGFNFSAGNFVYDAVSRERMMICVAYFGIVNSIGSFIGSNIGGILSDLEIELFKFPILTVFLISAILRFIVYFSMKNAIKEVRVNAKNFELSQSLNILRGFNFRFFGVHSISGKAAHSV